MNLLIFLVSVIFSFVFYFFYIVSNKKNFLGYNFSENLYYSSLSGNLIIESISFLVIGLIFYFYFSNISLERKKEPLDKLKNNNNSIKNFFLSNKKLFGIILIIIILLSVISYLFYTFLNNTIAISLFFLFLGINIFSYFYLTNLEKLKNNKVKIRALIFIFGYISIFLGIFYLIVFGLNFLIVFSILYLSLFNLFIHNEFENYISFLFGLIGINFLVYFFYYKLLFKVDDGIIFITLSLFVSLESILISYFYKFKYKADYLFFHVFSYIITVLSLFAYLILFKIDLFLLAIIFSIELIYISLSYYKLKQIK